MKKNFLLPFMALFTLLMASCGQEEIVSGGETKAPIVLSVNAPVDNATTKAAATLDGYTLTCILQLLDANNDQVGDQKTSTFTNGNATFTIDANTTATKALFWAEYRNASGNSVYNTDDLKSIGYATTAFDLSQATALAAADAFCGKLTTLSSGTVSLKRPFAQLNVAATNTASLSAYTGLAVTFSAPSGYSVLDQTTAGTTPVAYNRTSGFDPAETWFSAFVFSPITETAFNQDITMTLTAADEEDKVLTIDAGEMRTDDNKKTNATFDAQDLSKIVVTVGVDGDYEGPAAMAIGDYIYKDGTYGKTYDSNVIAIVYALATGQADNSAYGAGKTVKGYAMSIKTVARAFARDNTTEADATPFPNVTVTGTTPWENDYSGLAYTKVLTDAVGSYSSLLFNGYSTWKGTNAITASNLSEWYIPSSRQLMDLAGMLVGWAGPTPPEITVNDILKTAFENAGGPDLNTHSSTAFLLSSYMNSAQVPIMLSLDKDNTAVTIAGTGGSNAFIKLQAFIRPVLTIFE